MYLLFDIALNQKIKARFLSASFMFVIFVFLGTQYLAVDCCVYNK